MARPRTEPDHKNQIARNLDVALRADGRGAKEVSIAAGLNETAARDILSGRVKHPRYATLESLAAELRIPVARLIGAASSTPGGEPSVPIITDPPLTPEKAGAGAIGRIARIAALEGVPGAYGLYVRDDALAPALKTGDLMMVNPASPPRSGDLAVLRVNGARWQVRRIRQCGQTVTLEAEDGLDLEHVTHESLDYVHRVQAVVFA